MAKKDKVVIESKKVSLADMAKAAGGLIKWVPKTGIVRVIVPDKTVGYQRPGYKDTPAIFVPAIDPDTLTCFFLKLPAGAAAKLGMVAEQDVIVELSQFKNESNQIRYKVDAVAKIEDKVKLDHILGTFVKAPLTEEALDAARKALAGDEE
jgi:hypothetical protein